jgi:YD repeat-containing protein
VQGALTRTYSVNANGDTYAFTGPDGVSNQLTYDPFGRLASHIRSGVTTNYAVNAEDQRVAKSSPSTNSRYIYAGLNQLLAEYTNGQWTSYIWNGSEPIAMVRGNQTYFISY